tara:strand:+ start:281 stop:604 length:324 start_codon:yes stop_codon:yes gene_type:complete
METVTQQEISIKQFLELNKKHNIQIIDIREKYEYDSGAIFKSIHIPMDQILKSIEKIEKEKKVIIYCRSGRRSAAVKYMLERECELKNIYCLEGGYESYLNYQKKEK